MIGSRMILRRAWLPVLLLVALSCARATALVAGLDVPTDLAGTWVRLLAANPLPPDIETTPSAGGTLLADRILLERRRSVNATGPLPVPAPGERVVDVVPIAPVGRLGEGPESIAAAELARGVRVLALDQIRLPEIALGVDNRWPGEEGWQLFEQVVVRIEGENEELREWLAGVEELPEEAPTWVAAVGAIVPTRGIDTALVARGGVDRILGDTAALLRGTLVTAGRLEAAAASRSARPPKPSTPRFLPDALAALHAGGFTWLSPQGRAFESDATALHDTLLALSAGGIDGPGLGGQKPGMLVLDEAGVEALAAPPPAGTCTVVLAGGSAEVDQGTPAERRGALRRLVARGASLVIDTHPEEIRGLESFDGALVAHSLGTFLAPGVDQQSVILRVGFWKGKVRCVRLVPVRLKAGAVRLDTDPAALERLYDLTRKLPAAP